MVHLSKSMDASVRFLIIFHLCVISHAISVRDYASNKLQEYTVREGSHDEDDSELLEGNKFSMSTFHVGFDCEKKFKGQIIETEFNLLILSGRELYAINTNGNQSTIDKLAILDEVNFSPLDAKATFLTKENIIVVLAFPTQYNIYKIPIGSEEPTLMQPIQKIRIVQEIPVKIALYRRGEELLCLLASKISQYRGILRLYNWQLMHFKEEINQYVSGMDDVLYTNWNNNERAAIATVVFAVHKNIQVQLLDRYTLKQIQTLSVDGKIIRFIELFGRTFLLICPMNFCDIYQWSGVRFNHWRRVNLLGDFHEFRIGHNVIIYRFNHTLFVSNRADLTPIGSINCTTARIYFHKMHDSDTIWAVSTFLEPPQMRFNFIEITQKKVSDEVDADESSGRHLNDELPFVKFLECTKNLKQQFNAIYGAITRIASLNTGILRQDQPAEVTGKIIVKNFTKISENATVTEANVPIGIAATPTELLKNVAHLNLRKLELQTEIESAFEMVANTSSSSTPSSSRFKRDTNSTKNGTNSGSGHEKLHSIRRERIRIGNLRTNSEKFVNLLLKKSSKVQHINPISLKSLRAVNLNITDTINDINVDEDLYNSQNVVENKFFNVLQCRHLIVKNSINSIHINDFFGLFAKGRAHHSTTFHVDQVIVENIQEMNFDAFYQSLFLRNSSREIDGNLIFYNVTTANDMETEGINGRAIDDLVPLHTNQIINSTIHINQFRVEHFEADTVNDIGFWQHNLALIGKDNHFEGPIQLYGLYSKDLVLAEGDEETTERIIGTHIDDLSQVYMGQVTLKGNLHVGTLEIASKNNFLANVPFNLSSLGDFWYKGLDQDFTNVIFYGNVTAPQLHTQYVDHHKSQDFLTTHQKVVPKNATLFFDSAHIGGNLQLHDSIETLINRISESCVRVNERAVVRGVKNFTGNLRVENLITSRLNENLIAKMVLKNFSSLTIPSFKHFSTLHVHGNVHVGAENVYIDKIHATDLRELFDKCVMIDEAQNITSVQANAIQSRDIDVKTLNSVPFGKSIRDIEEMKIHVEIQGNATFSNNVHLTAANGVILDAFLPLVAQKSKPLQIGGVKNFTGKVKILKNMDIGQMNDVNVGDWLKNALVNGTNQTVKEMWTLDAVKAPKMHVNTINGIKVKHLMDSQGSAHFESDLTVEEITVNFGDISGRVNIDFDRTVELLKILPIRRWGVIHVEQNTHWPLGSLSPLTELLTNAIHAHREQEIVGEVHFLNASVSILHAHYGINGVYVERIAQDSLRKRAEYQVIFGDKHFLRAIEVQNLKSNDYLNVPLVNNIDILQLNATMLKRYQRDICVKAQWTFQSKLKTKSMDVLGRINGILPEKLVTTTQNYESKLPVTLFHKLAIVGNLSVNFVDNMPLDYLLYERARKVAEKNQDFRGTITFKDAILADHADVFSINDVEINSLFLTKATHAQDVTGLKKCRGNLELLGPSSVSYLNSRDIGDLYYNSLFLHKRHTIEDYGFSQIQTHELMVKESINGILLDTLSYIENSSLPGVSENMDIEEEIHTLMRKPNFAVAKKKRFIYFDYVNIMPLVLSKGTTPKVVRSVNIDADFGARVCNRSECQCGRRYSVAMLRDRSIVVRRIESVSRGSQKAWNGVEVSAGKHVQNCISPSAMAGANTTITFTIRHSGNVMKIEKMFQGGVFYLDFLKIESPTRKVLVTIGTIEGNLTRIHLVGVNKDTTPSVTIHQTVSLFSSNTTIYVMEFNKHVYLIVGTPKITLNGSILVYKLLKDTTEFVHSRTIEGNYFTIRCNDALGMIIVGNRGSNFMSIFKVDDESEDFKLFQSIKLQSALRSLSTFALAENQFFVIALQNDNIHIYQYNYIEGWILICVNQYPNIESLTPFTLDGEGYLLAITATNASAIALFSQTEH